MKQKLIPLALILSLLAACATASDPAPTPTPINSDPMLNELGIPPAVAVCRIADGARDGALMLTEEDGSIMRLGPRTEDFAVTVDGEPATEADLRDGMLVDVHFGGMVLASHPGQYAEVSALAAYTEGIDDRCGLYLQVLEDLWEVDPALNADIELMGLDLSGLTDLTEAEKDAVAWRFMETRGTPGVEVIQGTMEELYERGYITGETVSTEVVEGDTPGEAVLFTRWENGCHFSITGSAEEGFEARKWRSARGAYFFTGCTAEMAEDGTWTYEIGSEAIA